MKVAENKVYIALETNGNIPNPPDWLEEILLIDQFAQRFGWEFVTQGLGIKELDIEQLAGLQGILNGEQKKARMDELRGKLK